MKNTKGLYIQYHDRGNYHGSNKVEGLGLEQIMELLWVDGCPVVSACLTDIHGNAFLGYGLDNEGYWDWHGNDVSPTIARIILEAFLGDGIFIDGDGNQQVGRK